MAYLVRGISLDCRRLRRTCTVCCVLLAGWLNSGAKPAWAAIVSSDLAFGAAGQSMWGPGPSFSMDKTWDDFIFPFSSGGTQAIDETPLGTGVKAEYSYSGRAGLQPRLRINSGTVNVAYPILLNAKHPDEVIAGQTFTIDTADWIHKASSLESQGPLARFTLEAILELQATIGPGTLKAAGFDIVNIDAINLPVNFSKTLIDIGSGATGFEIPAGPFVTIQLKVPDQLNTETDALLPPELKKLIASGVGDDKFLNLQVDLDAIAISLFGLPPNTLGDTYNIVDTDENNDGKKDLSLSYELLNVLANLGLKFAQQFTFTPLAIDVTMTASTGEVQTGVLGDAFTFSSLGAQGAITVDAEYALRGQLRNQSGVVVNGSLQLQAGKFVLHNEYGPDFELNLAKDLLDLDSDFLFDKELPEGGIDSPPIYVFDSTFNLGGFDTQFAQYRVAVVPEPSSFALLSIAVVTLGVRFWRSGKGTTVG